MPNLFFLQVHPLLFCFWAGLGSGLEGSDGGLGLGMRFAVGLGREQHPVKQALFFFPCCRAGRVLCRAGGAYLGHQVSIYPEISKPVHGSGYGSWVESCHCDPMRPVRFEYPLIRPDATRCDPTRPDPTHPLAPTRPVIL